MSIKLYVSAIAEACITGAKKSDPAAEIRDEFVEDTEASDDSAIN